MIQPSRTRRIIAKRTQFSYYKRQNCT